MNTHARQDFSCVILDLQKARELELAKFDDNRQAVGILNPTRDNNEATYLGEEGKTPLSTACPEGR